MKDNFRQSMKWLHTWVGLAVVWVLFFMFITGTTGYFEEEITRWMEPERPLTAPDVSKAAMLDLGQAYLTEHANEAERWQITLPNSRDGNLKVRWDQAPKEGGTRGQRTIKILDARTGQESAEVRKTDGGDGLYEMHYRLHYLPTIVSYYIVGICTMLMLLAVITGVIFYKKIFKNFFIFRAKKGLVGWLDIHNVLSVIALPFHFMITYSGLIFFLSTYMFLGFNFSVNEAQEDEYYDHIFPDPISVEKADEANTLASLTAMYVQTKEYWPVDTLKVVEIEYPHDVNARVEFSRWETDISYNPNDKIFFNGAGEVINLPAQEFTVSGIIDDGFTSLHEGLFATPIVRWLYLLVGLIGAAMVASGGILWTTKRKPKQDKNPTGPDFGYRLVEQLNIGSFVGLPIAVAMYFWANRLLPIGMENRADWEMHCLFISWALLLIYPAFRPAISAWLEQLKLAAFVFTFIPVLNFLTTEKHLGITLPIGDWNYAAFDLVMLAIGGLFAFAAYKVQKRMKSDAAVKSKRTPVQSSSSLTPRISRVKANTPELTQNESNV